jgi:hypothetical protein
MRRNSKRLLIAGACIAALAASVMLAQQETGAIFRADTRLVVCHTTVVDKSGHLVTNLSQDAFTVTENGVPQSVKVFRREDVPVSMGLIIDNSGSMRDKRSKVEAASGIRTPTTRSSSSTLMTKPSWTTPTARISPPTLRRWKRP